MDKQHLTGAYFFPTLGVGMEESLRGDVPAMLAAFRAFNRWMDDDWGFAYKERIFAAPYITLADPQWAIALLRYFNPAGAHESGLIGEDPRGIPNNLMPFVSQVAVGKRARLQVFGNDYDTPDGTGVRDYVHVLDLASGHVDALRYLLDTKRSVTANLGTGRGHSVLELVDAFERASGHSVPIEIVGRRLGDVDACYADPALAHELFGWRAKRDLDAMCTDTWRWQKNNPNGLATIPSTITP